METTTTTTDVTSAHPNVQLLEQFYHKFHQRDMSLLELMHDDFVFDGTEHPILPHADILQTKMAFMGWSKNVYNVQFEHIDIVRERYDINADDESVVATLSVTFRNLKSDTVSTVPTLHHWTFKDGKAAGLRVAGV